MIITSSVASFRRLWPFVVSALTVAALPNQAAADGTLYFSRDSTSAGLYELNTTTGFATLVGTSGVDNSTVGLSESGVPGVLLGGAPFGLLAINADGSGSTAVNTALVAEGLAYDPTTGVGYSWWQDTGFDSFSPTTGNIIADLAGPPGNADIEGLAYANGNIYGLAGFSGPRGHLFRYNIASNAWSFVADTGIAFNESGLAYDPQLNVLYAIGSQDENLYRINPANGATQVIGPTGIGQAGGGLAFVVIPEPTGLGMAIAAMTALFARVRRARAACRQ